MKICKIKPSDDICCSCLDGQIQHGVILDCVMCEHKLTSYELLSICHGLFYDYAMVLMDGRIKKVPLKSVYNVREVSTEAWAMLNDKSFNLPKEKE